MSVQSIEAAAIRPGPQPLLRVAAGLFVVSAAIWALLLFRWVTFAGFDWTPLPLELALADGPSWLANLLFGGLLVLDLALGVGVARESTAARRLGLVRAAAGVVGGLAYYWLTRDFSGAFLFVGLAGLLLALLLRQTVLSLAYPAAYYLLVFFLIPNVIVLVVSLGERARLGTVTYPPFDVGNLGAYFDDYARFFSRIGGDYLYLRIFWRSLLMAVGNTVICLLVGFPFAYWIARRPPRFRNFLMLLVMIPFWTNFLVRTYAWMLILRDSGLINNFWTITLHEQAVLLADRAPFFAWLAEASANKLPLLFNTPAVMLGLFYGYLPFMVLPLYAALEKLDWSLLEAAADLGAGRWQSVRRVLLPLAMPGIAAGSIIVFIPSLGAYVTPDLMGGAKVSLLGNLLQQQFMTVRDWPFGSAIGFILMAVMLVAVIFYFRISTAEARA